MRYNWQHNNWPQFHYQIDEWMPEFLQYEQRCGQLQGLFQGIPESERDQFLIELMVTEAVKTSEIEGEYPQRSDVMSSIRRNLGLNHAPDEVKDQVAKGVANLAQRVRETWQQPLTEQELFHWHGLLLGYRAKQITVAGWRRHSEPMQIVSGPVGKQKIHFEAPPSSQVGQEMKGFFEWLARTASTGSQPIASAPLRAGIAHLYFESIHPFEDGNGRIGRAIVEVLLAQGLGAPIPFSLSLQIEAQRKDYYQALKDAQSDLDISGWLQYFIHTLLAAQNRAAELLEFTLAKARYLDCYRPQINARQEKALLRMLAEGTAGFEGGMNARKYCAITGSATATATRDLAKLATLGAIQRIGGGRSTRYELQLPK